MRLFTPSEVKIIAAALGFTTVVAILLVVLTGLPRDRKGSQEIGSESAFRGGFEVLVSDMLIPDEFTQSLDPEIVLSRRPLDRWTDELVSRYWIDPRTISLEILEKRNDRMIREMFEGVP